MKGTKATIEKYDTVCVSERDREIEREGERAREREREREDVEMD